MCMRAVPTASLSTGDIVYRSICNSFSFYDDKHITAQSSLTHPPQHLQQLAPPPCPALTPRPPERNVVRTDLGFIFRV